MIPGNMMCWKQFEHMIPLLEQDYHVISMRFFAIDEIAKEWVSGEYCEITSE